ncbi:unnamed protein product [Sphagnum jensenii]
MSTMDAIFAYVESGDVTGPESAGQGDFAVTFSTSYVGSASKQNPKQESRKDHVYMGRGPQAMESRLQMLRDLTTDRMGNSVLSDDVTLEALVPITRNLNNAQLEQCMNIAKRNALNR